GSAPVLPPAAVPSLFVAPIACPPLTPQPARARLNASGKWSRPASRLTRGVRPNSPIQITSVESSSPRSRRSVNSAAVPWSTGGIRVLSEVSSLPCVAPPDDCTSPHVTPASPSPPALPQPPPHPERP